MPRAIESLRMRGLPPAGFFQDDPPAAGIGGGILFKPSSPARSPSPSSSADRRAPQRPAGFERRRHRPWSPWPFLLQL